MFRFVVARWRFKLEADAPSFMTIIIAARESRRQRQEIDHPAIRHLLPRYEHPVVYSCITFFSASVSSAMNDFRIRDVVLP